MTSDLTYLGPCQPASPAMSPTSLRRCELLDRKAPRTVKRAHAVGAQLTYCGIAPLFTRPRAYAGHGTDWTISPITSTGGAAVMPAEARRNLELLRAAGIVFPLAYIAHEISKEHLNLPAPTAVGTSEPVLLTNEQNTKIVGPVPLPVRELDRSESLGQTAGRVLHGLGKLGSFLGAVASAPVTIAGAALSAATQTLDPVIFGVQPAGPSVDGAPAGWFVLAAWNW